MHVSGKIFMGIGLVLVLIGAILSERDNIVSYFAQAGLITLILNLIMMEPRCLSQVILVMI